MEKKKQKKMSDILKNKKTIIAIAILIPVLIAVIVLLNNVSYSEKENPNLQSINKEQIVEGLKISEGLIIKDKGLSNYTANVTNTTSESKKVEYVTFTFYDKDNKNIVTLYGYVGRELAAEESVQVSASVDKDITAAEKVEISVK